MNVSGTSIDTDGNPFAASIRRAIQAVFAATPANPVAIARGIQKLAGIDNYLDWVECQNKVCSGGKAVLFYPTFRDAAAAFFATVPAAAEEAWRGVDFMADDESSYIFPVMAICDSAQTRFMGWHVGTSPAIDQNFTLLDITTAAARRLGLDYVELELCGCGRDSGPGPEYFDIELCENYTADLAQH
jgi:hypothetical protein